MYLAASVTKLATIPHKGLLAALRRWWEGSQHLQGLTTVANDICQA
jgi:hypothetical protein